jgi:hypothetical protein
MKTDRATNALLTERSNLAVILRVFAKKRQIMESGGAICYMQTTRLCYAMYYNVTHSGDL